MANKWNTIDNYIKKTAEQSKHNPDCWWIDVRCNRCGSRGRLGQFQIEEPTEKEVEQIQKNWVCCPGPPLWWERFKKFLGRIICAQGGY